MAGEGVCLLLKEVADGKIKGSFRTTRDDIDVAAWAKTLGGGGHKKAAGFTSTGTIDEILEKILTIT
jgi:phosphoesterase RecJ-like protein